MEDLAIVVCACESYKKIWPGLLTSFNKHLKNISNLVYFTAPNEIFDQCKYANFELHFLPKKTSKKPWSDRLIETLKNINTNFFLLLIEDYYLEDNLNYNEFVKCFNYLKNHKEIGYIKLSEHMNYLNNSIDKVVDDFCVEKRKANYRISAQAGLWKKKYALKLLRKGEDAWYFEHNSSFRSRFYKEQPLTYDNRKTEIIRYFGGRLMEKGMLNKEIVSLIERNDDISFKNFSIDKSTLNVRQTSKFSILRKIYNRIFMILSIYIHFRYLQ